MTNSLKEPRFVICMKNEDYEGSLLLWKVYQAFPNPEDQKLGLLRVIDETEEDYLHPEEMFNFIQLPTLFFECRLQ